MRRCHSYCEGMIQFVGTITRSCWESVQDVDSSVSSRTQVLHHQPFFVNKECASRGESLIKLTGLRVLTPWSVQNNNLKFRIRYPIVKFGQFRFFFWLDRKKARQLAAYWHQTRCLNDPWRVTGSGTRSLYKVESFWVKNVWTRYHRNVSFDFAKIL